MSTNLRKSNRWMVHLLLAVAGTSGIAGLFLPFSWNTSPVKVVFEEDLWRLAAPALLSVLVTAATMRWIISGSFSKAEKAIAYIVSTVAAGVTLSFLFNGDMWPSHFHEWLTLAIPIVVLLSGVYLVIRNSRMLVSRKFNPLMAMQVAYIANCLMCLAMFWPNSSDFLSGDWEIGAYFCLAASIVYLIQIALFLTQRNEIYDQAEVSVP